MSESSANFSVMLPENIQSYVSYFIMAIALLILIYFIIKINVDNDHCRTMNKLYPNPNSSISNNNSGNTTSTNLPLHRFFVKSAYNACSGGSYKNDNVDICNLMSLLREGVRCLDFEIYSIDDQPAIATSVSDNYHVKETYDSVSFADVMSTLSSHAFTSGTCPNSSDPLIVHLRMKSQNQKIFSKMARILQSHATYMLGSEYNYDASVNLLKTAPISTLQKKIIIIVDKSNDAFMENAEFMEFVNMVSNSIDMRECRFNQMKDNDSELKTFNETHMTIVLPTKGSKDNPNFNLCKNNGCQFVAMMFQRDDDFLEECISFFNTNHSAFVLKSTPSST